MVAIVAEALQRDRRQGRRADAGPLGAVALHRPKARGVLAADEAVDQHGDLTPEVPDQQRAARRAPQRVGDLLDVAAGGGLGTERGHLHRALRDSRRQPPGLRRAAIEVQEPGQRKRPVVRQVPTLGVALGHGVQRVAPLRRARFDPKDLIEFRRRALEDAGRKEEERLLQGRRKLRELVGQLASRLALPLSPRFDIFGRHHSDRPFSPFGRRHLEERRRKVPILDRPVRAMLFERLDPELLREGQDNPTIQVRALRIGLEVEGELAPPPHDVAQAPVPHDAGVGPARAGLVHEQRRNILQVPQRLRPRRVDRIA
jgi:hypothetical protein